MSEQEEKRWMEANEYRGRHTQFHRRQQKQTQRLRILSFLDTSRAVSLGMANDWLGRGVISDSASVTRSCDVPLGSGVSQPQTKRAR